MTNGYKYTRVRLNIRWIDYCRIRQSFPALRDESAQLYFQRLAMALKSGFTVPGGTGIKVSKRK